MTKQRDLARDIRDSREGEVMATPDQVGLSQFWLRPVGGGYEWPVPRQYLQIIDRPAGDVDSAGDVR